MILLDISKKKVIKNQTNLSKKLYQGDIAHDKAKVMNIPPVLLLMIWNSYIN